jgi:hypothetical protein
MMFAVKDRRKEGEGDKKFPENEIDKALVVGPHNKQNNEDKKEIRVVTPSHDLEKML